jgi:2'-5' RNA ligase
MARRRTFIALPVPKAAVDRLSRLQEQLAQKGAGIKWVADENMHLTLHFLGEVDQYDLVKICRMVQKKAKNHAAFPCDIRGLGGFPNSRRPKILWAAIQDGSTEIRALHADLEEGLLELGCYRREDRGYNPHLTLGRLSQEDREGDEDWGALLEQYASWEGGTFTNEEVLVMTSDLRRDGPVYNVVGRAALGG